MDWMSPLNKLKFIEAVKAKAGTVTLVDGRKFNIEYLTGEYYANVHIYPSNPFILTPRGYFNIEKLIDVNNIEDMTH